MKKIKYTLFIVILLGIFLIPINTFAASKHGIGIRAYKCPMDDYEDESGDDKYYACLEDYLNGNFELKKKKFFGLF